MDKYINVIEKQLLMDLFWLYRDDVLDNEIHLCDENCMTCRKIEMVDAICNLLETAEHLNVLDELKNRFERCLQMEMGA